MVWGVVCSCKEGVMSLGKFLEMCRQNPGPHALRTPIQLRKRCLKAIMDQTSQMGSNICLKSSKIDPKFSKSRPKWCPNHLKSSPEAPKTSLKNRICFYIASRTNPTHFFFDFGIHFETQKSSKLHRKHEKYDVQK